MSQRGERVSASEDDTRRAGRELAVTLSPGDIVALSGSLGAGKTVFVRGLAEGLGLDPRQVHSPTFAMVTEYGAGASRLVHVDLYRIDRAAEIEDLGLDSLLSDGAVMAVEWGEKLPARLLQDAVRVTLEDLGGEQRRLTIERATSRPGA
ncbi:MAG: tRNA (adenosine(37)-N6)-threonylcarbamoyltransferase complex ATPase subunit type 1 TsaE [Candidatus Polarisedimenticolia bacterium]